MPASWIKEIAKTEIRTDRLYFIARKFGVRGDYYDFYSEYLSGKRGFTVKPGIALQYPGTENLLKEMEKHPDFVLVEVPKNAGTRWRARKPVPSWRKRRS